MEESARKMFIGADSYVPPDQSILDQLKKISGFHFWGAYVGGAGIYNGTLLWTQDRFDLLKNNGIAVLPIWVPKQDCSEDPYQQAHEAMSAVESFGLTGVVAIDGEKAMAANLNHGHWLDSCFMEINSNGWYPVNYEGSGYASGLAFSWAVKWGEHEEVPTHAEAIQYGPYLLPETQIQLDSDAADESFPLAQWKENPSPVTILSNNVPPQPPDNEKVKDATGQEINAPIVASIMLPDKTGSYMVGADGGVFPRGTAKLYGSLANIKLNQPIVAIECVDDTGYTLVAADGGRFPFGNQPDFGAL